MRRLLPLLFAVALSLTALNAAPSLRVACLGDSITEGAGTQDRTRESYPAQLAGLLGSAYEVRNFGCGGATLLDIGDKPYRSLPHFAKACAFQPEIIVIGLGTNDTKPQNWRYADRFVANYVSLIRQLRELPSHPRILICRPMPAWPPSGWGISPEIIERQLPSLLAEIAAAEKVPVIDLFTPMRDQHGLTPDHVHPNAAGAAILAQTVAAALQTRNP